MMDCTDALAEAWWEGFGISGFITVFACLMVATMTQRFRGNPSVMVWWLGLHGKKEDTVNKG